MAARVGGNAGTGRIGSACRRAAMSAPGAWGSASGNAGPLAHGVASGNAGPWRVGSACGERQCRPLARRVGVRGG